MDCETIELSISILDIITSSILGIITFILSKKLSALEFEKHKSSHQCCIILESHKNTQNYEHPQYLTNDEPDWEYGKDDLDFFCACINNYSEALLTQLIFDFGIEKFKSYLQLPKDKNICICIPIPKNFDYKSKVSVTYISCYNEKTYGEFIIIKSGPKERKRIIDYIFIQEKNTKQKKKEIQK